MTRKKRVVVEGELIDDYYSRIFFEKNIGRLSESALHVDRYEEMKLMKSSFCSCVILDRLLNKEYEYERVVEEARRILVSGGTLLAALSSCAPSTGQSESFWGFTIASAQHIFGKYFSAENIQIASFGNVLSGRMLLEGITASKLRAEELDDVDPFFPVIVGVIARKE